MNEPNQFELPADVRRLLDGERADQAAPAGARDRVRMRVGATVGLMAAGAAATSVAKAAAGSPGWLGWAPVGAKVLAPMLVGSALMGGALGLVSADRGGAPAAPVVRASKVRDPAPAKPVEAAAPPVVAEVIDAPEALEPAAPARPVPQAATRAVSGRVARSAPVQGPSALEQERLLLEDARGALAQGNATRTLALLDEHGLQHRQGQLREEALALRVMALVRAGDVRGARSAAESFRRQHPGSVLRAAVDAAVAGMP